MKTEQRLWTKECGWSAPADASIGTSANLVLAFGGTSLLKDPERYADIKSTYPNAHIMGCSTAGEIFGTSVCDDSLVATAVEFEKKGLQVAQVRITDVTGDVFDNLPRLVAQTFGCGWISFKLAEGK